MITERSGYVLQGADVNLFLAQYALEQEKDKAKAKEYAEAALKLATAMVRRIITRSRMKKRRLPG